MKGAKSQIVTGKPKLSVVIHEYHVHKTCGRCGVNTRQIVRTTNDGWEYHVCQECNDVSSYKTG